MFTFLSPIVAVLFPLPWIIRQILASVHDNSVISNAIKVPFFKRLENTGKEENISLNKTPLWAILAWVCLVIAAMRPAWLGAPIPVQNNARNIMLALDVSGSMEEEDFDLNGRPVTRLDMLKALTDEFIKSRSGDNVGLVIFGSLFSCCWPPVRPVGRSRPFGRR